jgi:hypothetical protein
MVLEAIFNLRRKGGDQVSQTLRRYQTSSTSALSLRITFWANIR